MARRGLVILGALLGGVWMFPLLMLVRSEQPVWIVIGFSVAMILFAMHAAPQAAYLADIYPSEVRFSALAFTTNAGGLIGGALAPITADRIAEVTGSVWWAAAVVLGVAILSCTCLVFLPDSFHGLRGLDRARSEHEPEAATVPAKA
ncbi:MFS transporter [Streptomyces sp. NBC_01716]|uniref:MFS transporter n=1 Tax=Streptomyces sp. NBC_01716 TaxID=2975917 RepID=UPI002E3152D5|nr:MFS transporter [Streptomyces sp. NBC_01716]